MIVSSGNPSLPFPQRALGMMPTVLLGVNDTAKF
jgi:hypothetical protein